MAARIRWGVVGALLIGILLAISGFRQVKVLTFKPGPMVVQVPYGGSPDAMGRAIGIDGRLYGPLTFVTNGQVTVVADTYRQRLVFFRKGHVTSLPMTGQMTEALAINEQGTLVAADNRSMALWKIQHGKVSPIVEFKPPKGYTEAIWHVGLSPKDRLYVERVRFGHGQFVVRLDEYTLAGQFVRRLAQAKGGHSGRLIPLSGSMINDPVRDFTLAPDGHVYIEPAEISGSERIIRIYQSNGAYLGQVVVHSPEPIHRSELLGISRQGWIYLAVNFDVPHRARVLVVNGQGQTIADLKVPTVSVYAANYGRVLPSGVLYLDESTSAQYQIRSFAPVTKMVWHWVGI